MLSETWRTESDGHSEAPGLAAPKQNWFILVNMTEDTATLLATLVRGPIQDVRHLLIEAVDGPASTNLIQLSAGHEKRLATGTEYQMRGEANELIAEWNGEGFQSKPLDHPVYEPLQAAVALALKLGKTTVYTDSVNMTGEVALKAWRGLPPKNGQPYEYAVHSLRLSAQPQLSASAIAELDAITDYAQWVKKAAELRRGEWREYILGGSL